MGDVAERIANARKEAEQLKERIKAKRDALADTTRNQGGHSFHTFVAILEYAQLFYS